MFFDPAPLTSIYHRALASLQNPPAAGVQHHQPRVTEVSMEAPSGPRGLSVSLVGELEKDRSCVFGFLDLLKKTILGKLGRREVAEVLVDPVGDVSTGDLLVPPRIGSYLLNPRLGDVPVVRYLGIVEDHSRGYGRKQPVDCRHGGRADGSERPEAHASRRALALRRARRLVRRRRLGVAVQVRGAAAA